MTGALFAAISAALVCTALVLILRQLLMAPVRLGRNTEQIVLLRVYGAEPRLEESLNSLLWLYENGILKARIIILGYELDEETMFVAKSFVSQYRTVTLVQDGEISQWIRNLS